MKNKPIIDAGKRKLSKLLHIVIISFIAITCLGTNLIAAPTYAQKTFISLNLENRTLKDAFKEIERNSEFVIFYYEGVIDANRKVKISVKNQPVNKVLDELFKNTDNT